MKSHHVFVSVLRAFGLVALLAFGASLTTRAQSGAAGSIEGRVFNPLTGEYIRNAEVRIDGTDRLVVSEADGTTGSPMFLPAA